MQLKTLIEEIKKEVYNFQDVTISDIEFDSRKVKKGTLFIAVPGEKFDGHKFIDDARNRGAVAVVTERRVETDLPQIVVPDTRKIMSILARKLYGDFNELKKIGITGTNGKTTTAFLIHSILNRARISTGLIGTIYYIGKEKTRAEKTTPEAPDIYRLLNKFRNEGIHYVVMEVSSHALKLERVETLKFDTVVFTNLSQDHLDFHQTIEDYKNSKLHIFDLLKDKGTAVVNMDDPIIKDIYRRPLKHIVTFGMNKNANFWAEVLDEDINGITVQINHQGKKYELNSRLFGQYNVYNILAAFTTAFLMNINPEIIAEGIRAVSRIPGRMEQVVENVFVDFAHTPDAIKNVLSSLRKYIKGKLYIVFGCGGDRDKEKRPKMGAVATELADFAIITSDNPRSEPPKKIINDIIKGIKGNNYKVIEDRAEAICYALKLKKKDDVVLVAGKGHEEYQILKDRTIPFRDAEVIVKCSVNL
ncbi:UDP-N-acetylmuramoyl-L-alanyl-D-glutamate--2,6-diaminopimelate ligase [candidate division WOR-3 bacterium 4484_100]|uniref:UDP-N-acetylmuramoyl-L-alanyl-D-glutamate--2,6-diaminopimelate ligase n=1 Tax=candidate division WOR-3 bacterium 4484_100 TaxID=1936077 RepID=A0A1V4QHX1_UNCW3|nr:MAG: UDP-N-acetylmuramoyl-L-alanyl-D-glutamate--2,6-diaminopimelate ligase [candidate division WOR-3 bacterium 4484_100]